MKAIEQVELLKFIERVKHAYLCSYLSSGVSFSQSGAVGLLVHSIKVHCDTKRNSYLVSSRVTPTNRATGVVHFVGDVKLG